jgi:two-component sensor histidine kinase
VSAMLAMQGRATDLPAVRDQLSKAVDRIQTIADVHAALYRSSSKDDVDFASYLKDLCDRLSGSLLIDDRISLEVSAAPVSLPLDRAVALGVLVNELVTNAAKYAYPPPRRGSICVNLQRESGALVLSVADSGKGLPPEAAAGKGLGMRLVRSLVQQLDGVLEVERRDGVTFNIRMKEPSVSPPALTEQNRLL